MKKVLISVLVSSLLLGAIIAKPKAKVESAPVPEPVPEMTIAQLCELLKQKFLPFKEVKAERALYKFSWSPDLPVYEYLWFVGVSDEGFDKSIWGTYDVSVNPYKSETRGFSDKETFVRYLADKNRVDVGDEMLSENVLKAYQKWDYPRGRVEPPTPEEHMARFVFVWVFSDGYYTFYPRAEGGERYSGCQGRVTKIIPDPQTGKVSGNFYYSWFFIGGEDPWRRSEGCTVEKYSFDKFAPLLEARLRKEGTAEQLSQWSSIKDTMQSYFAE